MSAFVNGTTDLSAYEESFVFPHALSAIAPTTTKFGITAKDLIGESTSARAFRLREANC
jgi:hypothetical protein